MNFVSELLWVKKLLTDIGISLQHILVVWCDNTSTISMVTNLTHHAKIKHVQIDNHFIHEKVQDGVLHVNFVPSVSQVAMSSPNLLTQNNSLSCEMCCVYSL